MGDEDEDAQNKANDDEMADRDSADYDRNARWWAAQNPNEFYGDCTQDSVVEETKTETGSEQRKELDGSLVESNAAKLESNAAKFSEFKKMNAENTQRGVVAENSPNVGLVSSYVAKMVDTANDSPKNSKKKKGVFNYF